MRKRILCPFHKESTPSLILYEERYKCYGCGKEGPLSDIGEEPTKAPSTPPEDLAKSLAYIRSLPNKSIRGLDLPCDSKYYYIVWPNGDYYKKRNLYQEKGSKYLCPRGHWKPLYFPYKVSSKVLAIVEGELNALSLAAVNPNFSICSPGGSSDFYGKNYDKYSKTYLTYDKFFVIVDKDGAGVKAALEIKSNLLKHTPYIEVILMDRLDCNDLLTKFGKDYLRAKMEVLTGVQSYESTVQTS